MPNEDICTRQKKWIGHILREDIFLLRDVLEEKLAGKTQRGLQRKTMLEWVFTQQQKRTNMKPCKENLKIEGRGDAGVWNLTLDRAPEEAI